MHIYNYSVPNECPGHVWKWSKNNVSVRVRIELCLSKDKQSFYLTLSHEQAHWMKLHTKLVVHQAPSFRCHAAVDRCNRMWGHAYYNTISMAIHCNIYISPRWKKNQWYFKIPVGLHHNAGLGIPITHILIFIKNHFRHTCEMISTYKIFYPRPVLAFGYCRCLRLSVCVSVRASITRLSAR